MLFKTAHALQLSPGCTVCVKLSRNTRDGATEGTKISASHNVRIEA